MLPRSSSNAGDRLRRAKSTSSARTSSSGHHRTSTTIDPFVTRQQAEAAAVEAFRRARPCQEAAHQAYRPVPPKLQRRRSQVTGKTEGSHFEDARLGRRRSNSRKGDTGRVRPARDQQNRQSEITSDSNGEEKVVARRRSVIPPNSNYRSSQYNPSLPSSGQRTRISQSGYTDGSPLPRHASTLKNRSSTLQLRTSLQNCSDGYDGNLAHLSDFHTSEDATMRNSRTPRRSIRETQTDEEILAVARDQCLHDFQSKKLRGRKSFMFAPFQKRRAGALQKGGESSYDTVLPPFNYADEGALPPPPPPPPLPPPEIVPPAAAVYVERKPRNFSDTLKGRIKKVFRKASRSPSGLPPQHIEAKEYRFSTNSPLSTPNVNLEKDDDPFTVAANQSHLAVPDIQRDTAGSRQSVDGQSTARSRVTSWTNSTVADTQSTRHESQYENSADEHGRLQQSDSVSTLRRATSFFGRPIKNKLRRPSRADLQSSEETAGLYSALRERIKPSDSVSQGLSSDGTNLSRPPSGLATLPSQLQTNSTVSSKSRWATPTVRSVTPDPAMCKLDILSPVTEVYSPDAKLSNKSSRREDEQSEATPRSQLQRRPAMKAPTPSKDQIARRIERSRNRWQSPLDELSPPAPRSTRANLEDNPYELRSLSWTVHQPVANNDLPHHARIGEQPNATRQDVLSPSLYSRGTDGVSPRPETPIEQGGMMVTITGREVKSYSISPPKREQPAERSIHGSRDWRRWLSDEMNGWDCSTAPEDFTLPQAVVEDSRPGEGALHVAKRRSERNSGGSRLESASYGIEPATVNSRAQRPRSSSRRPSYMNERYPIVDSGRNSSTQSDKTRKISSRTESRTSSVEPVSLNSAARDSKLSVEDVRPRSTLIRQRVVSKHQSIEQFGANARNKSALGGEGAKSSPDNTVMTDMRPSRLHEEAESQAEPKTKNSYRPKSAFDLRANYKDSNSGAARPIEVRRKANTSENIYILEDSTIQNISAGPYAPQPAAAMPADANKENTPPSEANSLPVLSSSEWLSAGTNKKRDARKIMDVHPAYRNRSVSRYSPSRVGNTTMGPGGSSPGQRLVSNWLEGKRSKENSPAFV